jgi:hypothetical protein
MIGSDISITQEGDIGDGDIGDVPLFTLFTQLLDVEAAALYFYVWPLPISFATVKLQWNITIVM